MQTLAGSTCDAYRSRQRARETPTRESPKRLISRDSYAYSKSEQTKGRVRSKGGSQEDGRWMIDNG